MRKELSKGREKVTFPVHRITARFWFVIKKFISLKIVQELW